MFSCSNCRNFGTILCPYEDPEPCSNHMTEKEYQQMNKEDDTSELIKNIILQDWFGKAEPYAT